MGVCSCNTQCSSNSTCGSHLGCPSYSDSIDPNTVAMPPRPNVNDEIDPTLINSLMSILHDYAYANYTANDLPSEIRHPYRNPAYLKRRVINNGGVKIPGQPNSYNINMANTSVPIETDDIIETERQPNTYNYPLDYIGINEYLSQDFKYNSSSTVTYTTDDPVHPNDDIDVTVLQDMWDAVKVAVTDCVCNYDRCNCNSVCGCNSQCSCNSDY